jgi:hypothetical protein
MGSRKSSIEREGSRERSRGGKKNRFAFVPKSRSKGRRSESPPRFKSMTA